MFHYYATGVTPANGGGQTWKRVCLRNRCP
jgi:hypothetical protein